MIGARGSEGIYRRVSVRMYSDAKFARLSPLAPSGQALWLYLLTGPHTGPIPGAFVIGRAAIAEALGWAPEAFEKAFAEVIGEGLVEFDAKARMWFIPNAIRHNIPPNPNVVKSWRAHWLLLPECAMRDRVFDQLLAALTEVSEAFGKALAEACGKAFGKASAKASAKASPKHSPKQEQEQEQEKEKSPSDLSAKPTIPCPYQSIVDLYHEKLPSLPKVKLMSPSRQRELRKFWGWLLSSSKSSGTRRAETAAQALAWIGEYFDLATENDFLMGRTERSAQHAGWRCDLDFLLTERGRKHVIERTEVAA